MIDKVPKPLRAVFDSHARYALAFSGGSDSSYLLAALIACDMDVRAYTVRTVFQEDFELEDARLVAQTLGARWQTIDVDMLSADDVCANPPDRCYLCKKRIFTAIEQRMLADGCSVLIDGTNASDDPARRPGFRALAEFGVVSPLRQAGMTKDDVRAAARTLGVPTADKPSFSCYATAVPAGERITARSLAAAAAQSKEERSRWMSVRTELFKR